MTADVRDERCQRLAEPAVHAANVQTGQSIIVSPPAETACRCSAPAPGRSSSREKR